MPHVIERAPTGRAKCRACGTAIPKGDLRVGEAVPNPFADAEGAETTHWYHPACAAYKRPEAFLAALDGFTGALDGRDALVGAASLGVAHRRLPRIDQVSRASSGRAACRACREPIPRDHWRISLRFWQDGRFAPGGYIHLGCAAAYLETTAILDRLAHFTPSLTAVDLAEIEVGLAHGDPASAAPAASDDGSGRN